MDDAARVPLEHNVGGVPIAQSQNVAHHGHDGEAACVVCPPLQPDLRVLTLDPEHGLQVLTQRLLQGVLEDLDLVRQRADLKVRAEIVHELVVDVWEDLVLLAVLLDQDVQSVGLADPADEASCCLTVAMPRSIGLIAKPEDPDDSADPTGESYKERSCTNLETWQ